MDSNGINFILNFVQIGKFFSKVEKETQTLMNNMMISKAYILLPKKGKYVETVVLLYSCRKNEDN